MCYATTTIISAIHVRIVCFALFVCLWMFSPAQMSAQDTARSGTPAGIAPGAPAGSYALSGFESINVFNGNISASFPLHTLGDRGEATYTTTLRITNNPWIIGSGFVECPPSLCWTHYPTPNWWSGIKPGYGPGVMNVRQSGKDIYQSNGDYYYGRTYTLMTFTVPDGTEYEFIDQETGGAFGGSGWYRGRVWTTHDGGASATFISDSAIGDLYFYYPGGGTTNVWGATGDLFMKNGLRYRIENGLVKWLRDRDGNRITFDYDGNSRIIKATDSLNREVTFAYSVNAGAPYGICDIITWRGAGGANRTIRVSRTNLGNVLRSGSLQTYQQLFPELSGSTTSLYNPNDMVSTLWLPDGRSYKFRYNGYGELARVELPSGGGFEYDYSGGSLTGPASGVIGPYTQVIAGDYTNTPPRLGVYRRLRERRVFTDIASQVREGTTIYDLPTVSGQPQTSTETVIVKNQDAVGTTINGEKHYYYGDAASSTLGDSLENHPRWDDGKEYQTEALDAALSGLRKIVHTWEQGVLPGGPRITAITTTLLETNQVATQTFAYDQYNNQTDVWEYDYGAGAQGALLRHTHTDYLTSGYDTIIGGVTNPDPAATIHIRNLPTSQAVYSDPGTANKMAETTYEYDDYATADGFHAQLVTRSGISGLCDGTAQNCPNGPNFTDFNYTTRGNVTKVSRWLNTPSGTVNTYQQYDVAGNVVKAIDANGNAAIFDFSDRFGSPDDDARANDPLPEPGSTWLGMQTTFAFATKVTNALGHETYTQYDYFLGRPVNSEDANGFVSSVAYNDDLDRPTQGIQARYKVTTPPCAPPSVCVPAEERQTTITYGDTNHVITTTSDRDTFNDNILTGKSYYDGLGRMWRSATYEGNTGSGNTWLITDTQFDALGRKSKVSNPFRLTAPDGVPGSVEWKTTEYDALSRVKTVTTPDGAFVTTTYSGNSVTVEDQHDPMDPDPAKRVGRKRRSETDALGRLTKMTEDPDTGGLNYDTTYLYDVLGNLRKVTQGAQTRFFAYDSLSRLIRAKNVEQGNLTAGTFSWPNPPNDEIQTRKPYTDPVTSQGAWSVSYAYDPAGNQIERTDANNITTRYKYDSLNRNTQMVYSSYPNGSFYVDRFYDGATNGKGRFWYDIAYNYRWEKPTDNLAYHHNKVNSYDSLGRPLDHVQNFLVLEGGSWQYKPFSLSRTYDLAGNVKTQTYPSGRMVNYGYDTAGRLNSFTGKLGGVTGPGNTDVNYTTDIQYNDYGLMKRETYGTQTMLYHNLHYNNRLQMVDFRVGDSPTDEWNYSRGAIAMLYGRAAVDAPDMFANCKDNNGNALRQLHYAPLAIGGDVVTQRDDYTYDSLNRIKSVTENQRDQSGQWTTSPVFTQAFLYDRWGNRTIDMAATTSGVPGVTLKNFAVDAATNRMTSVDGCTMIYDAAGNQTNDCVGTHYYDNENRMTKAVQGGQNNYYFYDANGKRVRRILNGSQTWNGQETWFVYGFDGELVAEYTYNQVTAPLPSAPQKEYGYHSGEMMMIWDGSQAGDDALKWLVTDHLGSTRWEINTSGSLPGTRRHDYLPFGEELVSSTGAQRSGVGYEPPASNVKHRFDAYERDNESGLDYAQARYYGSMQGRFTGVDRLYESAKASIPQSWNRYIYCLNNPLRYVDPDGLDWYVKDGTKEPVWFDGVPLEPGWSIVKDHVINEGDDGWVVFDPNHNVTAAFETEHEARTAYTKLIDSPYKISLLESALEMDMMISTVGIGARLGIKAVSRGVFERTATLAERRAAQLAINKIAAAEAELAAKEQLEALGYTILGSQVRARTSAGLRIIDHLVETPTGELLAVEVKQGKGARDALQLLKDSKMATEGAKLVGKNAPAALRGKTLTIKTVEFQIR